MIRAPFNFVPLSKEVVFPEWAESISHDMPFSDGISGSFCVNIKALTPIFVRNGHIRDINKWSDEYKSFSMTPDGTFFIPATSIKGELRHLLEIISFSKMQRIDDKRYSIRDVNNKQYRESFPYDSVHCGWMTIKDDGGVEITDNGIPYRISHRTIDEQLDTNFCTLFGEGVRIKDANRTAEYKYGKCGRDIFTTVYSFNEYKLYPNSAAVDKRVGVHFNPEGLIRGKIVFTGQPGNRRERKGSVAATGKFYEFVFPEIETPHVYKLEYDCELFNDFLFIYKDSDDWHFWKKKAQKEGLKVPVFFKVEDGCICSMGLSYMYKLPYKQRIKDFLNEQHKCCDFDMAECIFGESLSENSLKGRVHLSHAVCYEAFPFENEKGIAPYLGSPKPSYYPIYLVQQGSNGYLDDRSQFATMMKKNAELRGWKMYPTRLNTAPIPDVDDTQLDHTNPALPLGAGSEFRCIVRFHNLRPVELGALLYAVVLQKQSCHSLGFCKPYGYGVCKYNVDETKGFNAIDIEKYISSFIDYMEAHIPNFKKTPQMKELLLMTNPQQAQRIENGRSLNYMDLDEFVTCKQHTPKREKYGEYLPLFSELLKPIEKKASDSLQQLAEVTFFSGSIKQAKLKESKDLTTKLLDMNGKKDKLKAGDIIEVEIIKKGKELRYLRKK